MNTRMVLVLTYLPIRQGNGKRSVLLTLRSLLPISVLPLHILLIPMKGERQLRLVA